MVDQSVYFESVGAVHVHSSYSDGTRTIPEIAAIAQNKPLDFLMISDHNTLEPKRRGLEGWHGDVLVMIGYEINDPSDRNHYLAFRINEEIEAGLEAKDYVSRVHEKGGFGVIAHPAEKRSFSDDYPPYPWTDWEVQGFDGIEIWNQLSEWMEGVTHANIAWRIWHPLRSIRYPAWETLERWDQFNRHRRVVGIGGLDVHAFRYKVFGLIPVEIYPYKVQFRSIRTHLLTRRPLVADGKKLPFKEAEQEVFSSLSAGRCFVSNYSLGNASGFQYYARQEDEFFPMGSRLEGKKRTQFFVETPLPGLIRLIRDSQVIHRITGTQLFYESDREGVYRIEVYRKKRGWIYSNPIVLTS